MQRRRLSPKMASWYYGKFAHSLKPVLDRAYASAAAQAPIFTSLEPAPLVIGGSVQEAATDSRAAQPLANAPVLILFTHEGVYRGMVQVQTSVDGSFTLDLGALLDDYGIVGRDGLKLYVRVGNDTTHDAATVVLESAQLDASTVLGLIELPRR